MNVYVCEFSDGYCSGLVVVAANSEDEAYNVIKNDKALDWMFINVDGDGNYIENRDDWRERTICYHRKDFRLLKGVTADVETPQILTENHFRKI